MKYFSYRPNILFFGPPLFLLFDDLSSNRSIYQYQEYYLTDFFFFKRILLQNEILYFQSERSVQTRTNQSHVRFRFQALCQLADTELDGTKWSRSIDRWSDSILLSFLQWKIDFLNGYVFGRTHDFTLKDTFKDEINRLEINNIT